MEQTVLTSPPAFGTPQILRMSGSIQSTWEALTAMVGPVSARDDSLVGTLASTSLAPPACGIRTSTGSGAASVFAYSTQ
ncbi:hypothetical protein [Sorangium sp. So ce426]|uniref:hypothetical protein n=1 Tax=unclassified Sorangium TaxID=2621164 RepID=UPI003F5BBAD0